MSEHFKHIYGHHADTYDVLVSREDHQGNILPAVERIVPLSGSKVIELGAGSGRLTRLIAPHVASIDAFDASAHMLDEATSRLSDLAISNVTLAPAANRALPAPDGEADIAIAGWTLGHCCDWFPDTWKDEIGSALDEMSRVLRPGGTAIILETLGTGREQPHPPTERLARYYAWLEQDHGFSSISIRTDYRFESAQEGQDLFRFFFGEDFLQTVDVSDAVVPECTGIWWRRKHA